MTEADANISWREGLKRVGSFNALRPYLHGGQIPAEHDGLYTFPEGKLLSGPGFLRPEKWAVVDIDRAGRVIFFTEEVVFGSVVQEVVFAYAVGIKLDSVAFNAIFPAVTAPQEAGDHKEPAVPTIAAISEPPRATPPALQEPRAAPEEIVEAVVAPVPAKAARKTRITPETRDKTVRAIIALIDSGRDKGEAARTVASQFGYENPESLARLYRKHHREVRKQIAADRRISADKRR